jgi:hypothetical protein
MNNKKSKKEKTKTLKTKEQREIEIENIMGQLMDLGIPLEDKGIQEVIKTAKEFEVNGISNSGKINLIGFQRTLEYIFTTRPHVESRIILQHNPHL